MFALLSGAGLFSFLKKVVRGWLFYEKIKVSG